jgi:hypothetical protein
MHLPRSFVAKLTPLAVVCGIFTLSAAAADRVACLSQMGSIGNLPRPIGRHSGLTIKSQSHEA